MTRSPRYRYNILLHNEIVDYETITTNKEKSTYYIIDYDNTRSCILPLL